jgi:hypothetical protein
MPREGLEPTPPCGERILSPPRLPFRHLGKKWRRRADLNRCIGVLQTPALTTWLRRLKLLWSGRRDSNSRLPPWQGGVLPLNYFRTSFYIYYKMVPRRRFELLRAYAHHPLKMACLPDSTTSAFTTYKISYFAGVQFWQGRQDSNPRPAVLETAALPSELHPYSII